MITTLWTKNTVPLWRDLSVRRRMFRPYCSVTTYRRCTANCFTELWNSQGHVSKLWMCFYFTFICIRWLFGLYFFRCSSYNHVKWNTNFWRYAARLWRSIPVSGKFAFLRNRRFETSRFLPLQQHYKDLYLVWN